MAKQEKRTKTPSTTAQLAKLLREKLGETADLEFQNITNPIPGQPTTSFVTNGDVLVDKIMKLAVEGKQWAMQLVFDYVEGKPAQASTEDAESRQTEQRLDEISSEHLNQFAEQVIGRGTDAGGESSGDDPARPVSRLMDLPKNGTGGTEAG